MPEFKIGPTLNLATVDELVKEKIDVNMGDTLTLDLSATKQVDSAGVALILHWLRSCQSQGGELLLQGASKQLQTLLKAYELETVLSPEK